MKPRRLRRESRQDQRKRCNVSWREPARAWIVYTPPIRKTCCRKRVAAPMPELRQCEQTLQTELQTNDRAVHLRLAETLLCFLDGLRTAADTFDIEERQRIVRLVIKDILVSNETIVVRHSIPIFRHAIEQQITSPSILSALGTRGWSCGCAPSKSSAPYVW